MKYIYIYVYVCVYVYIYIIWLFPLYFCMPTKKPRHCPKRGDKCHIKTRPIRVHCWEPAIPASYKLTVEVGSKPKRQKHWKKIPRHEKFQPPRMGRRDNLFYSADILWSTIGLEGCSKKGNSKRSRVAAAKWQWFTCLFHYSILRSKDREKWPMKNLVTRWHTAPPSDRTISPGSQVQQHSHESVTGLRCNLHHVVWCCGCLFKYFGLMLFEYRYIFLDLYTLKISIISGIIHTLHGSTPQDAIVASVEGW